MPIEKIPGETAWSTLEHNANGRWPSPKFADRLYPRATPFANAHFHIRSDDKIFCIGSCFARELETSLARLGFSVLSVIRGLPQSPNRRTSDAGMFNKYNVASIRNELLWAIAEESPYHHDHVFIETEGDLLEDYQLAGQNYADEPQHARAFREAFNKSFSLITEADVVVVTLGLSEAWFDRETGLYLNASVPPKLVKRYPHRFELHVLDYHDTLKMLEESYELLQRGLSPGFRLLVTVSPVPLLATFRDQDVLVANTYSKAVLRSAVEQFSSGKENVAYFPSLEFVTLSDPRRVWDKRDFRHVDRSFVDHIMRRVMEEFCDYSRDDVIPENANVPFAMRKASVLPGKVSPGKGKLVRIRRAARDWARYIMRGLVGGLPWKTGRFVATMRRGYATLAGRSLVGHVDQWDGQYLEGWACRLNQAEPIKVKLMIGQHCIVEATADIPRRDVAEVHGPTCLRSGFCIPLSRAELQGIGKVQIVFSETGDDISNSPLTIGVAEHIATASSGSGPERQTAD